MSSDSAFHLEDLTCEKAFSILTNHSQSEFFKLVLISWHVRNIVVIEEFLMCLIGLRSEQVNSRSQYEQKIGELTQKQCLNYECLTVFLSLQGLLEYGCPRAMHPLWRNHKALEKTSSSASSLIHVSNG